MRLMLFLVLTVTGLISCGDGGGGSSSPSNEDAPGGVAYDAELSETEKEAMDESLITISSLILDGSQIRRFSEVFGGNTSANVMNFLGDRINWILSSSTDIEDRVTINSLNAETLATNQGTALWFTGKVIEPRTLQIEINDQNLPIPSTRVGIIQLGGVFTRISTIQQMTTLIHEARHSDCTGGILASDIERMKNGLLPDNHVCGHIHEICPPGHELEGEFACDSHPWGAYAVNTLYAYALAYECSSCTESQSITAEIITFDSISRLLYDVDDLLDGRYGNPDMSSSTDVR